MAWGKGGSTNVVKVTTNSRRAFSVPAADIVYLPASRSSASTVDFAREDASNLSTASRRQDQRLLKDITTRLANAPFTQPAKRESRSRTRRRIPSAPSSRRGSLSSLYSAPRKPKSLADEEFEIIFPSSMKAGPLPPCARRAQNRSVFQRSSSLPPSPPSRGSSGKGGLIDLSSPLFRVVDGPPKPIYQSSYAKAASRKVNEPPPATPWAAPPLLGLQPKRRYSFAFEEPERVEYFYTPQARTASAYQVTVPRPYVRHYAPLARNPTVYSYESDYDPTSITKAFRAVSEPRRRTTANTPSTSLAVRQAKASLGRIERELGMGTVSVGDDAPYMDEPIVTTTYVKPVKSVPRTGFIRGTAPPTRRSSYHYGVVTSRPPPPPIKGTRRHEIEARLETMVVPEPISYPTSYNTLRSRTTEARNKMDQHRTLLDRYLPVPTGPPNDVPYEVEYKFNELADRMPQLLPREKREHMRAASLPPYRPVQTKGAPINQYNDALRTRPFVPKVSDTRKRAREVLCRTKRDPHYFDY